MRGLGFRPSLRNLETALPSRITIRLPVDFQQQIKSAKAVSHRYGQYTSAFEQIRLRLEYHAMEKRELETIVETPQLGHATYLFAKPRSMETFLAIYTKTTKDDIRRNRDNVAEHLKFLGRVIHGTNPKAWLKELQQRIGLRRGIRQSKCDW